MITSRSFVFVGLVIFSLFLGTPVARALDVEQFAVFERSFTLAESVAEPYLDVTATITYTGPGGATATGLLFWDGGTTFKARFAPPTTGTWSYTTASSHPSLNNITGTFTCIPGTGKGGLTRMAGYPSHFARENGEPIFFLGDTNWELFTTDAAKLRTHASTLHYLDVMAGYDINAIHGTLYRNTPNEGGTCMTGGIIGPGFFQEVDTRIQYANSKGISIGIAIISGANLTAQLGNDLAAYTRFARYAIARFGAYNVYFLQGMEYQEAGLANTFWDSAGQAMAAINANQRLIGSHATGNSSSRTLAVYPWCTLGDYMQYQNEVNQHSMALTSRAASPKPVVNGEYGYWGKTPGSTGYVATLEEMRAITFNVTMAGSYTVTGAGVTYLGGRHRVDGKYEFNPDHPQIDQWYSLYKYFPILFKRTEYYKLAPADGLVSGPSGSRNYCLANPGIEYIAHTRANSTGLNFTLGFAESKTVSIERFDPRTGTFSALADYTGTGNFTLVPPDSQDWAYVLKVGPSGPPVPIAPAFSQHPASQSVVTGATATFTATASGYPAPVYQWFHNGDVITSASTATYSIPAATALDAGTYTVTATNSQGNATSTPATLTVLPAPDPAQPFLESAGQLVMEAENFTGSATNGDTTAWTLATALAGYSGTGHVETPNAGGANSASYAASAEVSYALRIATPGTYKIWLRRNGPDGASNSARLGVNGTSLVDSLDNGATGSTWGWFAAPATVTLAAGDHTLNLRRREDGYRVDKILLTTDTAFTPTGTGPAESPRATAAGALATFRTSYGLAADGSQDTATPAGDGVANLLKYAFNMLGTGVGQGTSLTTPNASVLLPEGFAGLPFADVDGTGKLQLTYIRRKATATPAPGITYTVEFSNDLGVTDPWAANPSATESAVSLDATFERVTVTDDAATPARRFVRVKITSVSP